MELHSGQAMQAVTALAVIGVGRRRVMDVLAGTKTLLCFVDFTFNQCNSSITEKKTFFLLLLDSVNQLRMPII